MSVGPEDDAPRPRAGDGFTDALTMAFGDTRADLFGVARLGLTEEGASGLAIVFHRGEPVVAAAQGGVDAGAARSWDDVSAGGLATDVVEPLREWRLCYASGDAGLDLQLRAAGAIAELDAASPVARAGGMAGFEQLCHVRGTATVRGERVPLDGLGTRGRSWGRPDWDRIALARTVAAWLDEDLAVSLSAIRPAGARDHEDERVGAVILDRDPETTRPRASAVADPRLSTTYDADGRQRAAGLELFVDDDYPRRAAGEVLCGTTLDLGRLRLQCAFFHWHMEGRTGCGRYDILARADGG